MSALFYDPDKRASEKQRSREADQAALQSGEKSQLELIRENSFVRAGRGKIDFSAVKSIRHLKV